uniref:Uncharacterized protein n=1 Tax=Arundo donax TaxID=35708 RepID=A0A0A8YCT7_ARUDO
MKCNSAPGYLLLLCFSSFHFSDISSLS